MSATVLSFPARTTCPCCGRACGEDELSECYTCGGKFCGSANRNCKSLCECDRLAAEFAERLRNDEARIAHPAMACGHGLAATGLPPKMGWLHTRGGRGGSGSSETIIPRFAVAHVSAHSRWTLA